jgi:hypothetical protein
MTHQVLTKAGGYTSEPAELERGDKVFKHGRLYYAKKPKKGVDVSTLPMPEKPPGYLAVYDPHHGYYFLLPFSIAGDVVTSPFQLVYAIAFGITYWDGGY